MASTGNIVRFRVAERLKGRLAAPLVAVLLAVVSGVSPESALGQIISPGKLATEHADLEGITNCTNCHTLGEKGISNSKCLDCHGLIQELIIANKGYHSSNSRQSCASCHKDHFGREFELVQIDTVEFRHNDTGYPLIASHQTVACSSCHTPRFVTSDRVLAEKKSLDALSATFLGLPGNCSTCHSDVNPHGSQFEPRDCASCHLERDFKEVPLFDHDRSEFPLTGQHKNVQCVDCHSSSNIEGIEEPVTIYADVDFASCLSCHEDEHEGSMQQSCESCHNTSGWNRINRRSFERTFDHDGTRFSLIGKHQALSCSSCHRKPATKTEYVNIVFKSDTRNKSYPHPESSQCMSCHIDYHQSVFEDNDNGAECQDCHDENGWQPSSFDITRHNDESQFELTGAHVATPCVACHENPALGHVGPVFQFTDTSCQTCHQGDNKHKQQFADTLGITTCENCHVTEVWSDVSFDHRQTEFPLVGAHQNQTCQSCHTNSSVLASNFEARDDTSFVRYRGVDMTCATCHETDDPHEGQFNGTTCNTCHDEVSFLIAAFDHNSTNFPLTGGHETVACVSCHKTETSDDGKTFSRFKPLSTQCEDCHDSDR